VDSERVLFIVVGVVIVVAVGQLLIRSGRRYLAGSVPAERAAAGPAANLVAVLFHLLTLGVVVLISVLAIGSDPQTRFLVQLGILLVVLAGVYGVALVQINRRRDEALIAEVETRESTTGLRIRPADPGADGPRVPPGSAIGPGGETRAR
jgi:protein-S-isoprenylcysteine O-methyltransferase Ste14